MLYLDKINDSAKQDYIIVTENKEQVQLYLYYFPTQESWYFDLSYGDFTVRGLQLTVSPNCLRSYRDLLPFGLSCISADGLDPLYISDFVQGRIKLYLLGSDEVEQVESLYYT